MTDPPSAHQESPNRRRSSVAYDPARDTFTEIPDTVSVTSGAIDEDSRKSSSPVRETKPAPEQSKMDASRKRQRSKSIDRDDTRQNVARSEEPVQKRSRPSPQAEARREKDSPAVASRQGPQDYRDRDGDRTAGQGSRIPSAYDRRPDGDRDGNRDRNRDRHGRNERERERPRPHADQNSSAAYQRRSPNQQRRRERTQSPSPIRNDAPTDRPFIRPGNARGRPRNVLAERQRLEAEREARLQQQAGNQPQRGVQDVSNQFYNARPEWVRERGRDWRQNESQIKGLRSYNNWIKSCMIQKFSPEEKSLGQEEELGWGEQAKEPEEKKPLLVLDIGCGKGGDLGKWQLAPQQVGLYVGLDPAATSIQQAKDRYQEMRRGRRPIFDSRFAVQDCFGEWIGNVPIINEVGIDPNAGSGQISRWGGGGFDIVTIMFSMHYAFESEQRVRMMLRNVAGCLKKGGRFIGVVPNSDVLAENIRGWYKKNPDKIPPPEKPAENGTTPNHKPNGETTASPSSASPKLKSPSTGVDDDSTPSWGNSIYKVRFPPTQTDASYKLSADGVFRPPFGWKYTYWMAEAVDVPEFVVPWEAFRAVAEQFGLEQRYRKGFLDIWDSETKGSDAMSRELSQLGVRMKVTRNEGGEPNLTEEEKEAVSFYHGFCFVKV